MALADLKSYDFATATVSVWVFKKSGNSTEPKFTGRWVAIASELSDLLKAAAASEAVRLTEVIEYSVLAQNNEASCLSLDALETHAGLLRDAVSAAIPSKKVSKLTQIANAAFYVVRFVKDDSVVLAVRRTDASWSSKKASNVISTLFSAEDTLTVDDSPKFNISKNIDFFVVGETVLVTHKNNFESVLSYKVAHVEKFSELCTDTCFIDVFSDISELTKYVGNNKIQLRRALAIQEKGHYKDEGFMSSLRSKSSAFGLVITFDDDGKIVPSEETCRDIFQALLDHRLKSHYTNVYDVQDAKVVSS